MSIGDLSVLGRRLFNALEMVHRLRSTGRLQDDPELAEMLESVTAEARELMRLIDEDLP